MENKPIPGQEPELPLEEIPLIPQQEELPPVIEELTFDAPVPVELSEPVPLFEPETLPLFPEETREPEPAVSLEASLFQVPETPEEHIIPEPEEDVDFSLPMNEPSSLLFEEESACNLSEEEPAFTLFVPEEEPVQEPVSFMDRIPEVEAPAEEETEADLTFLDDPAFAPVPQPEQNTEETTDQEYRDEIRQEPKAPEADPAPRATLKGRPKRKKGEGLLGIPNILVTVVWLALVVAIGVTLGRMLWVCAADVLAFGREDKKVTITVYESDTMDSIIDKLHDAGLIRYKSLFSLYAQISDAEEDIKPGIYDLNTRYDYHALVNFMSPSSTREVVELTIPEGYTCRQIFALLEENRVCTAVDIAAYAADGELSDYWFLEGLERGSEYCLEGYLFPDTYQFYKNSSPREALEKMLNNFDYRFSEELRNQIDTLNANVTDGSYTIQEIVIVASLIEKESAAPEESPTIASVIYNRLFNWEYPALLNIDAAIVYAQGGEADTIDTSIDSPYNTYRHTGLPPTAIANPGLSSLKAALAPVSSDYYFYVLNPSTGMHQFSTTQAEHDAWIAEFYD